jgi:predicted amidohydrolase
VKVALAQINPTVGDFDGNAAKIRENAAEGRIVDSGGPG